VVSGRLRVSHAFIDKRIDKDALSSGSEYFYRLFQNQCDCKSLLRESQSLRKLVSAIANLMVLQNTLGHDRSQSQLPPSGQREPRCPPL